MLKKVVIIWKGLSSQSFFRNVVVLAGGTALGQIIVLISLPLIARIYSPEQFGVLATYTSLLSIVVVISSLRYELAIPLPHKKEEALDLVILSFTILLIFSMLITILVLFFGNHIGGFLNSSALKRSFLWILPLSLLAAGGYQILNYWSIRNKEFDTLARTKFYQGLGLSGTQLGLGVLNFGILGLIIGDFVGRSSGAITLVRSLWKDSSSKFSEISFRNLYCALKSYKRFPLFLTPASFLNVLGQQVPTLFLMSMYSPQVVGYYALTQRILAVPITLIGRSIAQVYFSEVANLKHENDAVAIKRLFWSTTLRLFLIGIIPSIILILFGKHLLGLIFGVEWFKVGTYISVLSVSFLAQFVVSPLSQTFNILERQDLQLIWDALRFILVMGLMWLSSKLFSKDIYTIFALSAAQLISYISLLIMLHLSINEYNSSIHCKELKR